MRCLPRPQCIRSVDRMTPPGHPLPLEESSSPRTMKSPLDELLLALPGILTERTATCHQHRRAAAAGGRDAGEHKPGYNSATRLTSWLAVPPDASRTGHRARSDHRTMTRSILTSLTEFCSTTYEVFVESLGSMSCTRPSSRNSDAQSRALRTRRLIYLSIEYNSGNAVSRAAIPTKRLSARDSNGDSL